jgi:predicted Zn-dependent protease
MRAGYERQALGQSIRPGNPWLPFTGEGSPTRQVVWIESSAVNNPNHDRYWGRKTEQVAVGVRRMSGGTETLESLIAGCQRWLLVTRFWYIRGVDPWTILFTGLTRDGTFLVENGKITRAVRNLRFNESPIFMLNNVEAMGRPVRVSSSESGNAGSNVVVPPIRCRDFNFTSLSEAV